MSTAIVTASLVLSLFGSKPDEYNERSLCDLWAGAQCYATSCMKDSKERCAMVSRKCRGTTRASVPKDRADRTANCARAILKEKCGAPQPSECSGVNGP